MSLTIPPKLSCNNIVTSPFTSRLVAPVNIQALLVELPVNNVLVPVALPLKYITLALGVTIMVATTVDGDLV
jgi:hypothetical protein